MSCLMNQILIAEDEPRIASFLKKGLHAAQAGLPPQLLKTVRGMLAFRLRR